MKLSDSEVEIVGLLIEVCSPVQGRQYDANIELGGRKDEVAALAKKVGLKQAVVNAYLD